MFDGIPFSGALGIFDCQRRLFCRGHSRQTDISFSPVEFISDLVERTWCALCNASAAWQNTILCPTAEFDGPELLAAIQSGCRAAYDAIILTRPDARVRRPIRIRWDPTPDWSTLEKSDVTKDVLKRMKHNRETVLAVQVGDAWCQYAD
eukprot:gene9900-3109_t